MKPPLVKLFPVILFALALVAISAPGQTPKPTQRPSTTAMANFRVMQVQLTGLSSSGYAYSPATTEPAQGDVYMGDGQGTGWTIIVGSSNVTIVVKDAQGYQVGQSWPLTAATTYPLTNMNGLWLKGGFTISCTDGNSGAGCAATNAELFWRE